MGPGLQVTRKTPMDAALSFNRQRICTASQMTEKSCLLKSLNERVDQRATETNAAMTASKYPSFRQAARCTLMYRGH